MTNDMITFFILLGLINMIAYGFLNITGFGEWIRLPFTKKFSKEERKNGFRIHFKENFLYDQYMPNGFDSTPAKDHWVIRYFPLRVNRYGWFTIPNMNIAFILLFFFVPFFILKLFYKDTYDYSESTAPEPHFLLLPKSEFPTEDSIYSIYPNKIVELCAIQYNNQVIDSNRSIMEAERESKRRLKYVAQLNNKGLQQNFSLDYDAYNSIESEALTKEALGRGEG